MMYEQSNACSGSGRIRRGLLVPVADSKIADDGVAGDCKATF